MSQGQPAPDVAPAADDTTVEFNAFDRKVGRGYALWRRWTRLRAAVFASLFALEPPHRVIFCRFQLYKVMEVESLRCTL